MNPVRRRIGWLKHHARLAWCEAAARRAGLTLVPPNYAFRAPFKAGEVVIDVGTGDDPDLSRHMIATYRTKCYAVDPTRKHQAVLGALAAAEPNLEHICAALGPTSGTVRFHESLTNESGSILTDHQNIAHDPTESYEVEMVTLPALLARIGNPDVALLKIDLEGAEYDFLASLDAGSLRPVRQLIVEFHDGTVPRYTSVDTRAAVRRLTGFGLRAVNFNGRDVWFGW